VTLLATALLGGCEAGLKETSSAHIEDFISSVSNGANTIQAVLVEGEAPVASSGPSASVSGVGVMINGGSSQQTVIADGAFTRIVVAVDGFENYYELTVPSGTNQDILIGGSADAYARQLVIRYAVGDGGSVGAYSSQLMRFLRVGSGDIQISVAWSDSSDVDLHVIDPSGEEIYFGHRTAASGGTLDLDGNASCSRNSLPDGSTAFVSNENVVWPLNRALAGNYRVILDYWSACGNPSTDYVVTVQRKGVAPEIFTGTFVGSGAPSDTVTTFTY
jgi:uncharacterized protein YfaP (DUF2135 family)